MLELEFEKRQLAVSAAERETDYVLIDALFFASLMVEEGEAVRVAIVYNADGADGLAREVDTSPEGNDEVPTPAWDVTRLNRRPFDASTLAKLSPGLRYGTHLVVVGGSGADLWIDGIARRNLQTDGGRVARIAAPRSGVLVFEQQNEEILRFETGRSISPAIDVLGTDGPVRTAVGAITGQ